MKTRVAIAGKAAERAIQHSARRSQLRPTLYTSDAVMPETINIVRGQTEIRVERPKLHKVILLNDDYTPRNFVVRILRAEFRLGDGKAQQIMSTAHKLGACVVAVFTQEVAETKATNAIDAARKEGFPLMFTTEPEE